MSNPRRVRVRGPNAEITPHVTRVIVIFELASKITRLERRIVHKKWPRWREVMMMIVGELLAMPRPSVRMEIGFQRRDVAFCAPDQLVHETSLDPEVGLVRAQRAGHVLLERRREDPQFLSAFLRRYNLKKERIELRIL